MAGSTTIILSRTVNTQVITKRDYFFEAVSTDEILIRTVYYTKK